MKNIFDQSQYFFCLDIIYIIMTYIFFHLVYGCFQILFQFVGNQVSVILTCKWHILIWYKLHGRMKSLSYLLLGYPDLDKRFMRSVQK